MIRDSLLGAQEGTTWVAATESHTCTTKCTYTGASGPGRGDGLRAGAACHPARRGPAGGQSRRGRIVSSGGIGRLGLHFHSCGEEEGHAAKAKQTAAPEPAPSSQFCAGGGGGD